MQFQTIVEVVPIISSINAAVSVAAAAAASTTTTNNNNNNLDFEFTKPSYPDDKRKVKALIQE